MHHLWLRSLVRQLVCVASIASGSVGCALHTSPPSAGFPTPTDQVLTEWRRMQSEPRGLDRPVVLIAGWRGTGASIASLEANLRRLTGASDDEFLTLAHPLKATVEGAADAVVASVEQRWPSSDPNWTTEIDVVGYSIGGIIARVAASPREGETERRKRLRIRNLYTLATPHRGTTAWGAALKVDPAAWQVRTDSPLLARLDKSLATVDYMLTCYATLGDGIVGATNAAPPGEQPIWTTGAGRMSHFSIVRDRRILTDLALRLRNETPLQPTGSAPPTN